MVRLPSRVHIITAMGHGQGKANSFLGPVLPDNFSQRLELPGGLERQVFENAGFVQLVQRQ